MAHTFGLSELPFETPEDGDAVSDLALNIFAEAAQAIITAYTEDAWNEVAPDVPLFRTVHHHDPKPEEFNSKHLPALYVFRDISIPSHDKDTEKARESTITCLWVKEPATQDKRALRAPFFQAFNAAWSSIETRERDPAWIQEGDETDAGFVYGTNIMRACGFDSWRLSRVARASIDIAIENQKPVSYPGIIAEWKVVESTKFDGAAYPNLGNLSGDPDSPLTGGGFDIRLTTGGEEPLATPQHIRDPETAITEDDPEAFPP